MLTKFGKPSCAHLLTRKLKYIPYQPTRCAVNGRFNQKLLGTKLRNILLNYQPIRRAGEIIPPSQYDSKFPERLKLLNALRHYWELYPLVIVTGAAVTACILSIIWAINNKVDVVFTSHSRRNISRTMNLRDPTVHKLVTINQQYTPWPEMQDVLDKMTMAEKRALVRLQICDNP